MIDGLIGGKLYGKPEQGKCSNGNQYVTAKVKTAAGDGELVFVSVITFDKEVCNSLLVLDNGDSVCLSGSLTPKVWIPPKGEPRPSLSMLAHAIITPYHLNGKRQATSAKKRFDKGHHQGRRVTAADGLDDDLPWTLERS